MRYKTVIFDIDGTLLDTLEDVYEAVIHTLDVYHFPRRTREQVRGYVGDGAVALVRRSLPEGCDDATVEQALRTYRAYYTAHELDHTVPFPGVTELLQTLKQNGVQTAVLSNKPDASIQRLTEHFFPGLFDFVIGATEGIPNKPAPESVLHIMRALGATRDETIYIGDSEVDWALGANAEIPVALFTWGFRTQEELRALGATVLVPSAEALLALL